MSRLIPLSYPTLDAFGSLKDQNVLDPPLTATVAHGPEA